VNNVHGIKNVFILSISSEPGTNSAPTTILLTPRFARIGQHIISSLAEESEPSE